MAKPEGVDLHWRVLTAKRPGLSPDLPPGEEKWVGGEFVDADLGRAGCNPRRYVSDFQAIAGIGQLGGPIVSG
jgi:hypothetical protein